MSTLPLHPAINHFPVITSLLATGCLSLAIILPRPRRNEWVERCVLLLSLALVMMPFVIWTGRIWSSAMGIWPRGTWWPMHSPLGEQLRLHVIGAAISVALLTLSAGLARSFRHGKSPLWLFFAIVLASALMTGYTAHLGGRMAFGEPPMAAESNP